MPSGRPRVVLTIAVLCALVAAGSAALASQPPDPAAGSLVKGDLQCDGDVDPTDALMGLRDIAALPIVHFPPCPDIGGTFSWARVAGGGSHVWGDIDCDDDLDPVDALFVLRHVVKLSVDLAPGCLPMGSTYPHETPEPTMKPAPEQMQEMAVDMIIEGNSSASVGAIEDCGRINVDQILDADESDVDTLTFDILAITIPQKSAMTGFSVTLLYDPEALTVVSDDAGLMLAANAGSLVVDESDSLPDTDGEFSISTLDTGTGAAESGSGVLARVGVLAAAQAASGMYSLILDEPSHRDEMGQLWPPVFTSVGDVAMSQSCGG